MREPMCRSSLRRGLLAALVVVGLVSLGLGAQQASANIVNPNVVTYKTVIANPTSFPLALGYPTNAHPYAVLAAMGLTYSVNKDIPDFTGRTFWNIFSGRDWTGQTPAAQGDLPGITPAYPQYFQENRTWTTWDGRTGTIDGRIEQLAADIAQPTNWYPQNKLFRGIRQYLMDQKPYVGRYMPDWPWDFFGDPGHGNTPYGYQIQNCYINPNIVTNPNYCLIPFGIGFFPNTTNSQAADQWVSAMASYPVPALLFVRTSGTPAPKLDPSGRPDRLLLGIGYGSDTQGKSYYYAVDPSNNWAANWYEWIPTSYYSPTQYSVSGVAPLILTLQGSYSDVAIGSADWVEIEACSDWRTNMIQGYGDGTFRPALTVTRAQMAVVAARVSAGGDGLGGFVPPGTPTFTDVPTTHWAYRYIEYCKWKNIVTGYGTTFSPEATCGRDQMAIFLARTLNATSAYGGNGQNGGESFFTYYTPPSQYFSDVPTNHYAYKYIQFLEWWVRNTLSRFPNDAFPEKRTVAWVYVAPPGLSTFNPTATSTRDKMAEFVWRAMRYDRN